MSENGISKAGWHRDADGLIVYDEFDCDGVPTVLEVDKSINIVEIDEAKYECLDFNTAVVGLPNVVFK